MIRQERFCSAPEFEGDGINGLAAAKRIEIELDSFTRELLWFIQSRSLAPRGLQQLCADLVDGFPDRIGTPLLRKILATKREWVESSEILKLRSECGFDDSLSLSALVGRAFSVEDLPLEAWEVDFYESHVQEELATLPQVLMNFCLNPKAHIRDGVWFFDDLWGAIQILRDRFIESAKRRLADTVVAREITETLNFWYSRRRMVLIEGVPGTGRTESTRRWVDAHAGMVRFVEVPSSNDDRSFFASIARQLGVARGSSMKAQEIKVRIEEMLARSELMLAFDESQYLWAQYLRPRKTPDRLLWIKSIFDSGTPVALIALTDFSMWQAHYVQRTLWSDEQFERRVNRAIVFVPDDCVAEMRKSGKLVERGLNRRLIRLSARDLRDDMLKIAQAHFPQGNIRCHKLLASYAVGAHKKLGGGIREALESARYRAEKDGRDSVTFADIEAALIYDHGCVKPPVPIDSRSHCTPADKSFHNEHSLSPVSETASLT